MRGRRHVGEIERRDAADVIEDAGELARKRLELVRLQRDMGECGCVAHVVGGQAHGLESSNDARAPARRGRPRRAVVLRDRHRPARLGLPYRQRGACSVFESSIAIVIGPMPPGTGVIELAISLTGP